MNSNAGILQQGVAESGVQDGGLHRTISWTGAFWAASGVPALVLFNIGALSSTVGQPAWILWILSILMGFAQCFTYAEIAGLFPHKSGGASVYGAIAWVRYSKFIAPISVWCNWFAWSPVLALGTSLAGGYILTSLFPADAAINTWSLVLVHLDFVQPGLSLRINAVAILGTLLLLIAFAIQHHGISKATKTQMILGVTSLLPLILIGIVPLVTGDMPSQHFFPLLPLAHDALGKVIFGSYNMPGVTLIAGGMFIAAWATYGFETAVCYTSEFKDPKKDTFKAIFYSGLLCIGVFSLLPMAFQGHLGLGQLVTPAVVDAAGVVTTPAVYGGMLDPGLYDGTSVGLILAKMVGGGAVITNVIVAMLVLSLMLAVMTSMMGSSRTLYQGSVDGWLPKYLSRVNSHGAPTAAMWTDLTFNLVLLMMSNNIMLLAIGNVGYLIFNFLNLQSGWIHRLDRGNWNRPYKAKNWLLGLGAVFGFVNLAFMGMGADIWGPGTLRNGLIFAALIVPVFMYRHFVQDKGKFPAAFAKDMHLDDDVKTHGGWLPYAALVLAVVVVWVAHSYAVLP
ncbi:amino acid permease [Glaciimonas sp. PCH181]|nr:amino acid permease [Glaciimonas sp. PCH181]